MQRQDGLTLADKGQCGSSEFRRSVLSAVPKAEIVSPPFKVGVFNAQSVANKSASVCHWIAHNDLHIAAVVDTWHDGNDSPSLVACTPPGYRYIERARPRVDDLRPLNTNHGGVCLFHRGNMHVRPITLPSYDAFEYLSVYVQGSGMNSLVLVLYRPGSAIITDKFFESFTDLLERTVSYTSVIIAGDMNIHLDNLTDHHTIKFNHILAVFGLTHHVQSSTHRCGHILDVLITRSDLTTRSVYVDQPMSDHSTITAEVNLTVRQRIERVRRVRRCWRTFNVEEFIKDIEKSSLVQLPPSDVGELFALYDKTLRSVLDEHAPLKVSNLRTVSSSARWYNAECRSEKIKTRHLERIYRRTKTAESLSAWRQQFSRQRLVFQSRFKSYWTDTIKENIHDTRALWSQVNALLKPPPTVVTELLPADDFANHLTAKVNGIRATTASAPVADVEPRTTSALSAFHAVTICEIIAMLKKVPQKHFDLDPIPTWLVKKAAVVLAPVLCRMCNASLSSGTLPESQKHAIVRPLLKKPKLDPDDLNLYRPISNLTFTSKLVERVVAARFMKREHLCY